MVKERELIWYVNLRNIILVLMSGNKQGGQFPSHVMCDYTKK